MEAHLIPFKHGNALLLLCCVFYLAWWMLAFRPEHPVSGLRSGWLLIPAAIAGVMAVWQVVSGICGINMAQATVPTALICGIGIVVYIILLVISRLMLERPVTTELLLIVGWATMTAAELNALCTARVLFVPQTIILLVATLIVAALSLVCYLIYYTLSPVQGYIDGMIPLISVAVLTSVLLVAMR